MKIIKKIMGGAAYDLVKRTFLVVSMEEECQMALGITKDREKAIGIVYDFINGMLDPEDKAIVNPAISDEENDLWEKLFVVIPESENHDELEYPITIFHLDRVVKRMTSSEYEKYEAKH